MSLSRMFSKSGGGKKDGGLRAGDSRGRKAITNSIDHDHAQVVKFVDTSAEGGKAADMTRELFSFPKPEKKETMADYINGHKDGDVFPYIAITGKEEESKDSRLARLRSFVFPYGKSAKPEMRINGIILDMLVGSIHIDELKSHVNSTLLSKVELKENKRFKSVDEHNFSKPYIQLKRITGEFVPLLSGTADYTDLVFSLQDGRLLDHQIVVQSNRLPTNSVGIFELSCDYCIPTKDIRQLSLRYELARPIMRENFQWGSVSLSILISESDTPYLTPKVEAMAVVKAPYTALEEAEADPDHKDVTYTAAQIRQFRQLYSEGDIADNDEPMKERLKKSSYSKSTIRGQKKGVAGPSHLGGLDGWNQLEGMRKPLVGDGEASVSVGSGSEGGVQPSLATKSAWAAEQERLRFEMSRMKKQNDKMKGSDEGKEIEYKETPDNGVVLAGASDGSSGGEDSETMKALKRRTLNREKRGVSFREQDV